jgi:hypothetical protein
LANELAVLDQWRDAETNRSVKGLSEVKEKIGSIAAHKERFQQQEGGIAIRTACASSEFSRRF